jgi:hypothetical protein
MVTRNVIEAGAKAIAKDFELPGGRRAKLARVVARHLDWFDAAEARGMTWDDMIAVLAAAGAKRENELPLSRGALSSAVWRKRRGVDQPAQKVAGSSGARNQYRASGHSPRKLAAERLPASGGVMSQDAPGALNIRNAGPARSTARPARVGPAKTTGGAKQATRAGTPGERASTTSRAKRGGKTSNDAVLAYMRRAATIRRSPRDDE